jgi:hypothetical protein
MKEHQVDGEGPVVDMRRILRKTHMWARCCLQWIWSQKDWEHVDGLTAGE